MESWKPPVSQQHLKAGFLAWFNISSAVSLLETQIASDQIQEEQRFYSLEMLSFIKLSNNPADGDKSIERRIREYEKAGYSSIRKEILDIGDEFKGRPDRVSPLGSGRFSVSNTIYFGSPAKTKRALQYLMILIHSGFPLSLPRMNLKNPNEWYFVFKQGYELYPFPFLYYSLQFSDESVLKRIGQDVAYSDKLAFQLEIIIRSVANSYMGVFHYRKDSSLIFLSELLKAVSPAYWEPFFVQIWGKLLQNEELFSERNSACESFVYAGFRFIENEAILFSIISDILPFLDRFSNKVIGYLFAINQNTLFTKHRKSLVPLDLVNAIDEMVSKMHLKPENSLFALGNLNSLFSEGQFKVIQSKLGNIDFSLIKNERIWHIILFFAGGDRLIRGKIKSAVMSQNSLWATGIKDNTASSGFGMLRLHQLTERNNPNKGLVFSAAEILELYNKMKFAFGEINRLSGKGSIFDYSFHLEEMLLFLDTYRHELKKELDSDDVKAQITALYNHDTGYKDIIEGLSSPDHSVVVWALAELSGDIENRKMNIIALNLILNKLLLQAPPALEESLNYLTVWIEDDRNVTIIENNRDTIIKILQKFKENMPASADISFVQEMVVRIAFSLHKNGLKNKVISEWTTKGKSSRFNNIRQWIKIYELKQREINSLSADG